MSNSGTIAIQVIFAESVNDKQGLAPLNTRSAWVITGVSSHRHSTLPVFSQLERANSTTSVMAAPSPHQPPYQQYLQQNQQYLQQNRRTLSIATSNSSHSLQNPAASVQRSLSNRSTQSSSYVALLRKQKATVWCDRSQAEDPRTIAALRRAKERAEREMSGVPVISRVTPPGSQGGSFTSGMTKKIRHHGGTKLTVGYGGNMAGKSVKPRLSSNEVEDDEAYEDEWASTGGDWNAHTRSASGRLSTGQASNFDRHSTSDLQLPAHSRSPSDLVVDDRTPRPTDTMNSTGTNDYFAANTIQNTNPDVSPPEDEMKPIKEDDLKRRGSVDDRTMTLGGGRLFVANPDMDD